MSSVQGKYEQATVVLVSLALVAQLGNSSALCVGVTSDGTLVAGVSGDHLQLALWFFTSGFILLFCFGHSWFSQLDCSDLPSMRVLCHFAVGNTHGRLIPAPICTVGEF